MTTVPKLEQAIKHLMRSHRFYGELLQRFKRNKTRAIPTYGVAYTQQGLTLYYNDLWHSQFTTPQLAKILEHECKHIIHEHFKREVIIEPDFDRKNVVKEDNLTDQLKKSGLAKDLNICEDVAINQSIKGLPENFYIYEKDDIVVDTRETIVDKQSGDKIKNPEYNKPMKCNTCNLENFKELFDSNVNIKSNMPFEYYYNLLKKHGKTTNLNIVTIDTHDLSSVTKGKEVKDPELRKEIAKQICNEAARATREFQAGCISNDVQEFLDFMNKHPKDWKSDLSKFVSRSSSIKKEITRTKRNRRQRKESPLIPGYKHSTNLTLLWIVDNSGSMSDEELKQIAAEGKKLHTIGAQLLLVQFDTKINSVIPYKGEKLFKRTGAGGTSFSPVFDYIEKKEYKQQNIQNIDGIVFFTDGGCYEDPKSLIKPKVPILWAMTEGNTKPVDWGWETEIKLT